MLTFTQAIKEITFYGKDMAAADVHVATAVGNEKPKKKKPTTMTEIDSEGDDGDEALGGGDIVDAFKLNVSVAKIDDDHQHIFGWASVCTVNGTLVVDKQDDIIPVDEIEKSAYEFVQFGRDMGDMHERIGTGRMIESMVFTAEKAKCGIAARDENGHTIEGWWVGFHVIDAAAWKAFKSGERPELSIGGRASWDEADGPTVAQQ